MESSGVSVNTIAPLLMNIINTPEDCSSNLLAVTEFLEAAPEVVVQHAQKYIIGVLNTFITKAKNSVDYKTKSIFTKLLGVLFKKSRVDELKVFLFAYKFLLEEVYDHCQHNCVATIDEDHKLEVMQTMIVLSQSLTWDVLEKLYDKDNALVLCQMIYVALEMAKSEQYRILRIACIECIMCLSRVDDSSDFSDIDLRCRIADVFILFLPGITSSLAKIVVEDEKQGHAVAVCSLKAWGRIVTLQMQNYNPLNEPEQFGVTSDVVYAPKTKWKTPAEIKQYLDNSKRSSTWYKQTDEKLSSIISTFSKLTHHSHTRVRKQLLETCFLIIDHCHITIPKTSSNAINHLIGLSEDQETDISQRSVDILRSLSCKLSESAFRCLFQNLEESLYVAVIALPRVFNTLDENEQLSAINLIVGYLKVFGKTKLTQILHMPSQINHLIHGLIHISKIDIKDVRLYDEHIFEELGECNSRGTPWKNFRYFCNDSIQFKIEQACGLLATCDSLDVASDLLTEIFINCPDDRKEATLLLNRVIYGLAGSTLDSNCMSVCESVFDLYTDSSYWNLALDVTPNNVILEVQDNVVQICLQLEGLGRIALVMEQKFQQKMFKSLYPVLEYAGSKHSLIRTTATSTIKNISKACDFESVHQLVHKNLDYLTYHILRRLHKREETESALKALGTVLKYGDIDTLHFFMGDLLRSCDKFFQDHSLDSYLHVFRIVVKSIRTSLGIKFIIEPINSKKQKELEHEPFRISNMCEEDQNWDRHDEVNDNDEIVADDNQKVIPMYIKLTEELLQRCVHFLPSKKRHLKILVIEIFKDGLEILQNWDDNMLPLVHQIWSPLIDRFKEQEDFVLLNYSFQLLIVLARLSKDFIRSRTAKDVLPLIRQVLLKLIKSSLLQDKGSAYRYTQAYKLQLIILQHLGRVMIDLDLADKDIVQTMEVIFPYLSKYQPIPIQEATVTFYSDLIKFDDQLVKRTIEDVFKSVSNNEKVNYEKNINRLLDLCTS